MNLKRTLLLFSFLNIIFILSLTGVLANSAWVADKEGDPAISIIMLALVNLPLNFLMVAILFRKFRSGRNLNLKFSEFFRALLIIIFIVTLIGAFTDFYIADISSDHYPLTDQGEVLEIFDFLTGNIIALSMIFISFFIPLKFILRQGIKNSVMISFCITMVNIFSWFFLFPKSYNPNVCIVISVLLFGSAIWQGIKFREWFKKQKKKKFS